MFLSIGLLTCLRRRSNIMDIADIKLLIYLICVGIGYVWAKWLYKKTQYLAPNEPEPTKGHLLGCGIVCFITIPACLFFTIIFYVKHGKKK